MRRCRVTQGMWGHMAWQSCFLHIPLQPPAHVPTSEVTLTISAGEEITLYLTLFDVLPQSVNQVRFQIHSPLFVPLPYDP